MNTTFSPQRSHMQRALDDAKAHLLENHGGPFGACIVRDDKIIAVAHNTVLKQHDPTCHAEVNAIRLAARALGQHDLSGCTIYSTTEPCPMCFGAIHWARISALVYGTSIGDVHALGFNELGISNDYLKNAGASPVTLIGGFMRQECLNLLHEWQRSSHCVTY